MVAVTTGRIVSASSDDELLDRQAVADLLGISRESLDVYRIRSGPNYEKFPEPDERPYGHPVWKRSTVDAWIETRPGRGAGGHNREPVDGRKRPRGKHRK